MPEEPALPTLWEYYDAITGISFMTKCEYRENAYLIIYLVKSVLHEVNLTKEKIKNTDLKLLYTVTENHMLSAITAYALESSGVHESRFKEAKARSIRKSIIFDTERDKIYKELEGHKIWYMPLKGIVLKDYYPLIGMREMCDNDILYNVTRSYDVNKIMLSLGFQGTNTHTGHDMVFHKKPVCNFEMHYALFSESLDDRFRKYYSNIFSKLQSVVGKRYEYRFSDEDFYIYMTAHEYKHFNQGGTGLRSLVDAYVFLNHFSEKLDMTYIEGELDKLGIQEYEHKRRQLVFDIFDKGRINTEQKTLLDYYIFSGTYGNIENSVKNSTDKSVLSKIKYISKRVFLPLSLIKNAYPFFYKHKYLIPFLFIYRLYLVVTKSRKKVVSEIKALIM